MDRNPRRSSEAPRCSDLALLPPVTEPETIGAIIGRFTTSRSVNDRQDDRRELSYFARMSNRPRQPNPPAKSKVTVPRDHNVDGSPGHKSERTPSAVDANQPDEDYNDGDKPLVAGSAEARALHERPPPAPGELGAGTAGDAARPIKPGVHTKGVPPRGKL